MLLKLAKLNYLYLHLISMRIVVPSKHNQISPQNIKPSIITKGTLGTTILQKIFELYQLGTYNNSYWSNELTIIFCTTNLTEIQRVP